MPTLLGPRFGAGFTGRPTRMSEEDLPIWARYFPKIRPTTLALYFDVGLGLADNLPASDDAEQLLGWIKNTQKRADVILERAEDVLLIELRFNAQLNAVGRLYGYRLLLEEDNPFHKIIIPVLVTNRRDSEVERAALALKIAYDVV